MSKATRERPDRYIQLHHFLLTSEAWKLSTVYARAIYVQLASRYNGANNGKIAYSVRDGAKECGVSKNTVTRALGELVELGFVEETRHGDLSGKTRVASEWRLTAFKCDLTGALKTCAFLHRGAQARALRQPRSRPHAATVTLRLFKP